MDTLSGKVQFPHNLMKVGRSTLIKAAHQRKKSPNLFLDPLALIPFLVYPSAFNTNWANTKDSGFDDLI